MGIANDYFEKRFAKLDLKKNGDGYHINISYKATGQKMDRVQTMLDAQIWQDMQKYMPRDVGTLIAETNALNVTTKGEVYIYPPTSAYGHYQWEGIKYVDQLTGKGAFFSEEYGFWSRPIAKYGELARKVPSDTPLFYTNPQAEAHWDEVAIANHKKEWTSMVRKELLR